MDEPTEPASTTLDTMDVGWRASFEQAWASWQAGNFGIGAALIDPETNHVISVGRNRVAQTAPEPGLLSGNMTAHAEMNAFAALDRFNANGLHLYTTLQPCLMCAASAMLLRVSHVFLAARDEFFDGLDGVWAGHPMTAERVPTTWGPFAGDHHRFAQFARLLPLVFTFEHLTGGAADGIARETHPRLATLADELVAGEAAELRRLETASEAIEALWDRLPGD